MPIIFLTIRGVQAARVVASPAFKRLAPAAQKATLKRLGIETAKGAATRTIIASVVGEIVNEVFSFDLFNQFVVPGSMGLLVTKDEAVGQILSGRPSKAAITTTLFNPLGVTQTAVRTPRNRVIVRIKQIVFLRQGPGGLPTRSQAAIR